jgi:3-oxoacyl-[acyl-carrier protein] reductase
VRDEPRGRLAGKRALITGVAPGIGHATALPFAAEGAHAALVNVTADGLDEPERLLASEGSHGARRRPFGRKSTFGARARAPRARAGWLDEAIANAAVLSVIRYLHNL